MQHSLSEDSDSDSASDVTGGVTSATGVVIGATGSVTGTTSGRVALSMGCCTTERAISLHAWSFPGRMALLFDTQKQSRLLSHAPTPSTLSEWHTRPFSSSYAIVIFFSARHRHPSCRYSWAIRAAPQATVFSMFREELTL